MAISNPTGPKTELSSPKKEFCLAPVGGFRPTWPSSPTRHQSESHVHLTALQWPSASFLPRQEPAVSKTPGFHEASQPGTVAVGAGSFFLPCSGSLSSIPLPPTVYMVGMLVPGSGASETRRPQYTQAG